MRNPWLLLLCLPLGAQELAPLRLGLGAPTVRAAAGPVLARPVPLLSLSILPSLSAPKLSPSVAAPAAPSPQEKPSAVSGLKALAAGVAGPSFSSVQGQVYDSAAGKIPSFSAPVPDPEVKAPAGVRRVTVTTVRGPADIDAAIPRGQNSDELIEGLKRRVASMAPYGVRAYEDMGGGRFTGIDVSGRPDLVDQIPELHPHEIALIRKILARNPDVQVLVREDGKTPDLVVGGKIVELKSFLYPNEDYDTFMGPTLLSKADEQIRQHGGRHRYKGGTIVMDLTLHKDVPADVARVIGRWLSSRKGAVVNKVIVFAGDKMAVFERQADGTFKSVEPVFAMSLIPVWGFSLS